MAMTKRHVVLISAPTFGNLVPTVEFAQRLADHHPPLIPIVFLISVPNRPVVNDYNRAAAASHPKIRFIHLPPVALPSADEYTCPIGQLSLLMEKHAPLVQQDLAGVDVAAMFVDMFCTPIADVAAELSIPCYLFFASPATFLGYILHLEDLDLEADESSVPCFVNPLPKGVLPSSVVKSRDGCSWLIKHAHRYMEMKGMVVNTLAELEPHALHSLTKLKNSPPVYAVGPVLDLAGPVSWHPDRTNQKSILTWLDAQPPSSVAFLCFGSMGSLSAPQVREIASGLERSGHRFLWSLREPPKAKTFSPTDYSNLEEAALPEGFLDRTAGIGLVCGWAPQVTVLEHGAVGGFVTHCGWNSLLESLWHGVPTATWPIYAEQQMNAFEMVKELGLAVELRLDYREGSELVRGEEVERRVRELMAEDSEVRRKVKEMREVSRRAVVEGGSSYESLTRLVQQLLV